MALIMDLLSSPRRLSGERNSVRAEGVRRIKGGEWPRFFFITASGFYRPAMCLSVLHFLPNVYCLLIAA
jgi:hypothetical protein